MQSTKDYTPIIEAVKLKLQAENGKEIAPGLRYDYASVSIADKPAPGHSTPVEFRLIFSPITADTDGDNSAEALAELGHDALVEAWLESLNIEIEQGAVFFDY